jgi:hypothetical protein
MAEWQASQYRTLIPGKATALHTMQQLLDMIAIGVEWGMV